MNATHITQAFDLPVSYRSVELHFAAFLQASPYSHKFLVNVYGLEIAFEPDEEGNYRALVAPEQLQTNKHIDAALLQAIAIAIEAIVK